MTTDLNVLDGEDSNTITILPIQAAHSREQRELASALVEFQFLMPVVPKNHNAKIPTKSGGEYEYSYADLADIIEAAKPHKHECGLAVTQEPGFLFRGETLYHTLTTTLMHKSGQWRERTWIVLHSGDIRALGSSLTYCRRYAQCAVLGIVPDLDDDGELSAAAWGEDSTRAKRRSAPPASSTSTRGTRSGSGRSKVTAQDPHTEGKAQLDATSRNEIVRHLAQLDPPIRGEAVVGHLNTVLGLPEDAPLKSVAKLTVEDGVKLAEILKINLTGGKK